MIARRRELAVAARLQIGADGIVAGAEPISMESGGPKAVLLLHGFGDTPQTLGYLAEYLHARGWTVRVPLLPGHGRTLREFAASRARAWIGHARAELEALHARQNGPIAVVGLSMGGAIASVLAADRPDTPALVLIAPYLSMPTTLRRLAGLHWVWGPVVPYVLGRGGDRSIHDEAERVKSLGYGVATARLLRELQRLVGLATRALPRIAVPTLVVHSREDNRIPPDAAERAFGSVGADAKRLEWVEGCGHVITVDYGRERVFELTAAWLESHVAASEARSVS